MILAYLKARRRIITAVVLISAVFALVFGLCEVPLRVSGYAALVGIFIVVLYMIADFLRFREKHRQLRQVSRMIGEGLVTEQYLPVPEMLLEEDYADILNQLMDEHRRVQQSVNDRYADMVEYYTLWAHQIKTPIAAMRLLLQSEERPPAEELSEELQEIEQYVEMVMGFLRLTSGSTDYRIARYDLDSIVRQVVRKYASQFIRRRIRLQYEPLSCTVLTDEKWLSFVIEQVLSNALKYTKAGSITITLQAPKTLCIADTGIGILPEDLPRIFEKGYTGYNGREDKKASGIGLYLCRQICERLGHRIRATSQVGEGSNIYIELEEHTLEVE